MLPKIHFTLVLAAGLGSLVAAASPNFSPNQVHWGLDSERIVL